MNRKMTDLALPGSIGALGASGLANLLAPSAATAWLARKPSFDSMSIRPRLVKPAPACQRNSRRVRLQKFRPAGELLWVVDMEFYFLRRRHGLEARDTKGVIRITGFQPVRLSRGKGTRSG